MTPAEVLAALKARVEWADEHELPVPFSAADARALLVVAEATIPILASVPKQVLAGTGITNFIEIYIGAGELRRIDAALARLGKEEGE